MDKVRIQDDLFNYVNGEWIENAVIPDDRPTTGGFADLRDDVEKTMMAEFRTMNENGEYPNELLSNACALYRAALDTKKRNRLGIRPVQKDLSRIEKLSGIAHFNRNLSELVLDDLPLPFVLGVHDDMKDSSKNSLYLQGPSTILPDTTYYKEGMEEQKQQLTAVWRGMADELLQHTGLTEEARARVIDDALAFDEIIAGLVKSSEEWSEYTKEYNPMTTRRVGTLLRPVNYKKLLEKLFGFVPEMTVVADVRFLKGFHTLFNENTFALWKHWAMIQLLISVSDRLSEKLREQGSVYNRTLSGVACIPSVEKYAYRMAGDYYSEPVGLYYGEKYFGEEAKKDIVEMVQEIIDTYKKRIARNTILSDATKDKAILKLSAMKVKMGYPDRVEEIYSKLVFNPADSLYAITKTLNRILIEDSFAQLTKPVNKEKWVMPAHMVNACYNPFANDITFPAAILQAPFYSVKQTRSQNLGGIGAVIGHEISHAFDNNGAQMDENGSLNNWWTKEDEKRFKKSTRAMIREFEGIELPWGTVNSALIVSENIADNGGMACTLDIMSHMQDANYEEYFINFAKIWCIKAKPEYQQLLLSVDVHAPAILRANMNPRNFPEWYETFHVTSKDKMYLAPSKRVVIW